MGQSRGLRPAAKRSVVARVFPETLAALDANEIWSSPNTTTLNAAAELFIVQFSAPVRALSGGQRQSVAIARAVYFNARILIMDEPTAALGPQETQMVAELIAELKKQGLGIFLISHDIHDVMDLCDRVSVMKNGQLVGTERVEDVTDDDILGMIILGKKPGQNGDAAA